MFEQKYRNVSPPQFKNVVDRAGSDSYSESGSEDDFALPPMGADHELPGESRSSEEVSTSGPSKSNSLEARKKAANATANPLPELSRP
jgi:hypothetical protein